MLSLKSKENVENMVNIKLKFSRSSLWVIKMYFNIKFGKVRSYLVLKSESGTRTKAKVTALAFDDKLSWQTKGEPGDRWSLRPLIN